MEQNRAAAAAASLFLQSKFKQISSHSALNANRLLTPNHQKSPKASPKLSNLMPKKTRINLSWILTMKMWMESHPKSRLPLQSKPNDVQCQKSGRQIHFLGKTLSKFFFLAQSHKISTPGLGYLLTSHVISRTI